MITEHDAVRRLVLICPGFHDSLVSFRDSGGNPQESFNLIAELAEAVVVQTKAKDFTCVGDLFTEFEKVLADADPEARQVLVTGFLEDVHNFTVRFNKPEDQIDPDALLPYLGPKTRSEWFQLVGTYIRWGETWPGRTADD